MTFDRSKAYDAVASVTLSKESQLAEQLKLALAEVDRLTSILAMPILEFAMQLESSARELARLAVAERVADSANSLHGLIQAASSSPSASNLLNEFNAALAEWRVARDREIATKLRGK